MSPTIVLEDGQPIMTVGAAGGPTIITQVVQALVRRLDLGLPLDQAIGLPRVHHQWSPDAVRIESRLDASLQTALTDRGHKLTPVGSMGVSQAIWFDKGSGQFLGVHDPRVPGKAAGL
jgi:gamma-glutamyltranspeptidase/glutathione hydrolase